MPLKILRSGVVIPCLLCLFACGENYRAEPLLLENQVLAKQIVSGYDDQEIIQRTGKLLEQFITLLKDNNCPGAWELLSRDYRSHFATLTGDRQSAQTQFCEGYKVSGDMLVKGNWVDFLLGSRAYYITTVPPELDMLETSSKTLMYVVQRDGSYRALLLVDEGGTERLEPL